MNVRKLIRRIKFHIGKKDIIYPDDMNRYMPDTLFDNDVIVTVVSYVKEKDTYIILMNNKKLLQDM